MARVLVLDSTEKYVRLIGILLESSLINRHVQTNVMEKRIRIEPYAYVPIDKLLQSPTMGTQKEES
jgi:hypothetical protein